MSTLAKILVIEDDVTLSTFLKIVLEEEGYEVLIAHNGQEGLSFLSPGDMPDLIMFDIRMPVMDGRAFFTEFRRLYKIQRPLIVMTAADDAEQRAQEMGVPTFLAKPFGIPLLISTVKQQLGA